MCHARLLYPRGKEGRLPCLMTLIDDIWPAMVVVAIIESRREGTMSVGSQARTDLLIIF